MYMLTQARGQVSVQLPSGTLPKTPKNHTGENNTRFSSPAP